VQKKKIVLPGSLRPSHENIMNCLSRIYSHCAVVTIIVSLAACNNYGMLDQLENPGKSANTPDGGFTALYLFTAGPTNGNVKGSFSTAREGADSLCSVARSDYSFPNNSCNQIRAMISLSTSDTIANMPVNYGIPGNRAINAPNGFTLAPDWFTLISGTSGNSLSPNVMPAATLWWSFSTLGGDFDSLNNCLGGSDGSSIYTGATGNSSVTGATWFGSGSQFCNNSAQFLCICY
jgi:hypothetical protein